jgi:glycosyltransferase involved in cell wall biosynthesis
MRILFLSDFYPPRLGGLELQAQALAQGMVQRGHRASVATLTLGPPGVSEEDGVTVHRLRGWNRALASVYQQRERPYHPTVPDPGVVASLARIVHSERPQVISAHSWIVYSFLPLKRLCSAPLVMRLHDYSLVCAKKTFVYRGSACAGPNYTKCLRCATEQYGRIVAAGVTTGLNLMAPLLRHSVDAFVANSNDVAEASYRGTGRPISEIRVIPPWLADGAFSRRQSPRPAFLPPEGDFLMFAGALSRQKGLYALLEAYDGLASRIPLVLVGTPRKDTPTRLPKGVRLITNVPHKDVLAAWRHCAIAVVPSLTEAFGGSAMEAMAAGRPVVASAVGGLAEAIADGETGLLVPPGDPMALRDAITRLLDDPSEMKRMGAKGQSRAMLYSASKALPEMEAIYAGLMRGVRAGA